MQSDARSMPRWATPGVRAHLAVSRTATRPIEALEPRLFLSRTITGTVFEDLNADGKHQHKEPLLRSVAVFLDLNGNGVTDAGEPATVTNKRGAFTFRKLAAGVYDVVQIPPAGDVPTLPAGGLAVVNLTKKHSAKLAFGDHVAPVLQHATDTTPPAAGLSAAAIAAPSAQRYQFSVLWTDATAVDPSSFGDGNIVVSGPGGFAEPAILAALDSATPGSPRTATYQISAPAGGWTAEDNGVYTVVLQAGQVRDALGNTDSSVALGTFAVAIDAATPATPVLLPASDTGTSASDGITSLNNASPASALKFTVGNTMPGATVTLFADGMPIGTAATASTITLVTTDGATVLADGPHTITTSQAMAGGTPSLQSSSLAITIDATAPSAALSAGPITAAGSGSYTFTVTYSDDTAVTVATLDGSDIVVTGPHGFNRAAALVNMDGNSDAPSRTATYRIPAPGGAWTSAVNGSYTITLKAGQVTDIAGNAAAGRTLGTFAVSIGVTTSPAPGAPALLAASDTGASNSDNITALDNSSPAASLQFSVPATIAGATVTLYADGAPFVAAVSSGGTITLATLGNATLANGSHVITARQTIPGNSESADSSPIGIVVDTIAPTASSNPPAVSGAGGTAYSFLVVYRDNLSLNVSTFGTGDVIVTGPNGFSVLATFVSVNSQTNGMPRTVMYSITPPGGAWTAADNGSYLIQLQSGQAFDTAGNSAAAATIGNFTVNVAIPASPVPAAPVLAAASDTGSSATDGVTRLNNASPAAALQFSVAGTVVGATVTLFADGAPISSAIASDTTTLITTSGTAALADGPHTFTARQTAPGDGQSLDSAATSVTIDTAGPTVSALSAPDVAADSAGATAYTFTVTYADDTGIDVTTLNGNDIVVTNSALAYSAAATLVSIDTPTNGSPRTATYQITPPGGAWTSGANGTYTITLQAGIVADIAGNAAVGGVLGSFTATLP
ncbi:MAG: conserved repeat domain protein [Phycisphaerales bacterium]|nr:conserved repeat domain protein [Phycisphaerales bacterium]